MQDVGVIVPTSTEITLSPSKDSSDNKGSSTSQNKLSTDREHRSIQGDLIKVESKETTLSDALIMGMFASKSSIRWVSTGLIQTHYNNLYYRTNNKNTYEVLSKCIFMFVCELSRRRLHACHVQVYYLINFVHLYL